MDALAWSAIAASAGVGLLLLAVMKWVFDLSSKLSIADTMSVTALTKAEVLGTEFHNFRVETAGKVADIAARAEGAVTLVVGAENRFAKALDDFGERIEKLVDRMDRVLENRGAH